MVRPRTSSPLLRTLIAKPSSPQGCFRNNFLQIRPFNLPSLSSLTPSLASPAPRSLMATKTLPFPPLPLFRTISAVESYGEFLPFLTASTVTARDSTTGYPTLAYLTVGYGPLSETFLSKVECNEANWTVGARSGERAFPRKNPIMHNNKVGEDDGGIFEYLDTIWKLEPLQEKMTGVEQTKVQLSVNFRFRSAVHGAMMSAVEDQVAGTMVEAFEKRVREIHGNI